jgi:ribosomal protein S4
MKATDLIISKGRAVSKAEARHLIVQGALRINGKLIIVEEGDNLNDLEVEVNPGDKIQIGRQEFQQ